MTTASLLSTTDTTIRHRCGIQPQARIVVALSGGADSVALLCLLVELGYDVAAAHCNFHLRGEESLRDEAFCRQLCADMHRTLHVEHFDTATEASTTGESIEMAARRLRYAWFERLRRDESYAAVAIAHHRDDNVETMLLNLLRGTGIHGLTGMDYRRSCFIRPLLDTTRAELLDYLATRHQGYVTDSTNADTRFKRNFIRHRLLPLLRELNPSADATLAADMRRLRDAAEAYDRLGHEQLRRAIRTDGRLTRIDLSLLDGRAAFDALSRRFGFAEAITTRLVSWPSVSERAIFESADFLAVVRNHTLELCRRSPEFAPVRIPDEGAISLPDGRRISLQRYDRKVLPEIPRERCRVALDADRITGSLVYRALLPADRFSPFGMKGTKLVSDYLADQHISLPLRRWARVLTDDAGIIWLAGERPDRHAAITPDTRHVVVISYDDNPTYTGTSPNND